MAIPERYEPHISVDAASASPIGPRQTNWTIGLMLFGASVVAAVQIGKPVVALPAISAELRLSLVTAGWLVGLISLIGAVAGVFIGSWVDRFGHRRSTLLGLVLLAISGGAGAASPGTAVLLTSRFGEGLGFMLTTLGAPALLHAVTSARHHGVVFGIWSTFIPLGTTLAIVGAPLLLDHGGWRMVWLASSLLAAGWAVLLAITTRVPAASPTRQQPPPPPLVPLRPVLRRVLRSQGIMALAVIFALYTAQYLSATTVLPGILTDTYRFAPHQAALLAAAVSLVSAGGHLLGGWLTGTHLPRWLLITAAAVVFLADGVGVFADGVPWGLAMACLVLFFLVGGMIPAVVFSVAPEFAPGPGTVATSVGLVCQGASIGLLVGPPAAAAVVTAMGGWSGMLVFLSIASTATIVTALFLRRVESSHSRPA
jgi:CP family cyanate transporter-like MFS transporter